MKECDILGSNHTLTPHTYFQGVKIPNLPRIYAPDFITSYFRVLYVSIFWRCTNSVFFPFLVHGLRVLLGINYVPLPRHRRRRTHAAWQVQHHRRHREYRAQTRLPRRQD